MSWALITYLYLAIGSVITFLLSVATYANIAVLLYTFISSFIEDELILRVKLISWVLGPFLLIGTLSAIYPDRDDIKLIAGAYLAEQLVSVDGVSDLPKNAVDALNTFLGDIAVKEVKAGE